MGEPYNYTDEAITNRGYESGYRGKINAYDAVVRIRIDAIARLDEVALHRTRMWLAAFADGWDMRRAEHAANDALRHDEPVTMCKCGAPDVEHVDGEGCQPEWSEAAS